MDMTSPPTSARSCSSMASDLIDEDREKPPTLSFIDRLHSAKRRGSATSMGSNGEDYDMDMVLDNFFELHNEIGDIESSLTGGTPKVSPRLDEYAAAYQRQSMPSTTSSTLHPPGPNVIYESPLSLRMNLVDIPLSDPHGENGVYMVPADVDSRALLSNIQNSQQRLCQSGGVLRKKTLTFQVSISVYDDDFIKEENAVTGPQLLTTTGHSENFVTATSSPASQHQNKVTVVNNVKKSKDMLPSKTAQSPSGAVKSRDKGKDKSKKSNLLRHIYRTNCNAFRVQISFGSKLNPNGKFSRNTREEKDALWLCELAILFIHQPTAKDYLFQWGNYDYLIEFGFCDSYDNYVTSLLREVVDLTGRGLIKPAEFESLRVIISSLFPSLGSDIALLDLDEIIRVGKINKKKMAAAAHKNKVKASQKQSSPAARAGEGKGGEGKGKASPKVGKVTIPVLQLPTNTSSIGTPPVTSPVLAPRPPPPPPAHVTMGSNQDNIASDNEKSDNIISIHGLFQHQFMLPPNSTNNIGHFETGGNSSTREDDVDSKRRRVPAHNPSHQSPRTLEMFQNPRR